MAVCEKCGTSFEPKKTGKVTTLRVLCEPCALARAKEKGLVTSSSAPAAVAAPPAGRRDTAQVKLPPAPKRPVRAEREPVEEAEEQEEAEAPKSKGKRRVAEKPMHEPRKRGISTATIGWIAAAVVVVGCGAALYFILGKKHADEKVVEEYVAKITGIYDRIKTLAAQGTEQSSQELLAYAAANEATWKDCEFAADITTLVAKAKNQLEKLRQSRELQGAMDAVESGLTGIENRTPEEIAELLRGLSDVEPRAEGQGADFVARTAKARTVLERAYTNALHQLAKTFAEANPDKGRAALQHFTKAEDEVIKLFDASIKSKNKEAEAFFRGEYKALITESDALVAATFPPEAIDQLPWKDLLTGEQAGYWNPVTVKGFSHHLEGGTLTMIGPDADAKGEGLISIGDREQWRDFVVDLEFTLESGSFDLYLRIGTKADGTVPQVNFTAGQDGLVAGKSYEVTGKMIGSSLEVSAYPEDMEVAVANLQWAMSRRGGLGFSLKENTRLKITRLRVRELRMSGK